jgi:hypothetical protein
VNVPQSTLEKPLTAIDYIAAMEQCTHFGELVEYAKFVPADVVEDERFARAFKDRLETIRGKR